MQRAARFLSAIAACSVLIVGCSSGTADTATPSPGATTTADRSGSAAPSSAATSGGTGTGTSGGPATTDAQGTSADDPSGAPTGGDPAPDLDAPTVSWFDTFCAGLAPLGTLDLSEEVNSGPTDAPDPADPDNSIQKQTLVSSVSAAAAAFSQTSQALAAQEPPTFDGGAEFATAAVSGLGAAGEQISAAVTTFDTVPAGATDEYWAAKNALRTAALSALAPLQTLTEPPADVQGGVRQIPSCQALGL
jgi:hypothetical protein